MKFLKKGWILLVFGLLLLVFPMQVWAKPGSSGENPPAAGATAAPTATANTPKGVVTGKIVNQNDAAKSVSDLEVMLHVLDKDQNEMGMLHGRSMKDGSYEIADVPFQAGIGYVAVVAYEGTTYYSPLANSEDGKTSLSIDVPVYESTPDLSQVQVDQMHVLFSFSSDGVDVKQVYALSNLGDRTVKDGVAIPGTQGAKAAVQFPLPENADFINFQPQDASRFVKFAGGFVDTAALVPGQMVSQFVVGYLLPYSTPLTYPLKTVLPVKAVNFVLPKDAGVTLKGDGLGEPEPVTSQDGQLFYLYKLENIPAGKTVEVTFNGKPVIPNGQTTSAGTAAATRLPNPMPLLVGLGILGMALIGGGAFWWVRSSRRAETAEEVEEEEDLVPGDPFERMLNDIAMLDQRFEQGELEEGTYREQRALLMAQAKAIDAAVIQQEMAANAAEDTVEAKPAEK